MALNLITHMKHYNWERPHGLHMVTGAMLAATLLVSCSAEAEDQEPISLPAIVTLDDCLTLSEQELLTACFDQLDKQDVVEVAALEAQEDALNVQNDALRDQNEQTQAHIEDGRTTVKVLSKEVNEAMKDLEERILEPQE